ncbi:MAG: DNA repair exonuclease [Gemmatimonadetes bacterium]|uniref:DNA repair exonuclease n=1 Tax=Candidatus Kutchimonas denitrificans TaxID=3056748 RepID=A0AAE4ZBL6_9BACT|nr:DNA repair exonuclease [Gemmatimonadota bacterium]NIR76282.1 DNA repair exonuclease [Candidatus Kutchimonas denitrificans]NIS02305.1 DNA repair exonuclease [Gemmatimonadota bacterium]NIT68124.1 DNA repair exonuclease [Gemmatimonadota bacterium]NIU54348.1 DNA repair exonuclease [Gemmatimonadota bacterium]
MKLVHAADLHLGYRAYHRTDPRGINIREADVARAFRELLERAAKLEPELLIIAGDVFHTVRPSNIAIADAFRRLSRFRSETAGTRVVIVAGNHDSPKAAETGSILRLFEEIDGVYVAHHEARRLAFPDLDTAILCLPHAELYGGASVAIEPDPDATHNVLVAHAEIDDERLKLLMDFGAAKLQRNEIEPTDWSYVALGHYHLRTQLAPNMYYAGAIERTSLNIWAEADDARVEKEDTWKRAEWGKGFIEFDLDGGRAVFHKLANPRPVLDLDPILYYDQTPGELDQAIEAAVTGIPDGIAGKIVRLRIFNVPREIYRELDHKKIRGFRTEALHFNLEPKPPQVERRVASGAPGRRMTLREELESFLKARFKPESDSVDREALIALGLRYLHEAEEKESLEGRE